MNTLFFHNDDLDYAIDCFRFLILGDGEISGEDFANKIRKIFDCKHNLHNKNCANTIEKYIKTIVYQLTGSITICYKTEE